MLACTRSLMNRASRSSTYSSPHIIFSSEARPILLLASSSPPGTSLANTADTDFSSWVRMAAISSGLGIGTPGTYQLAAGSSSTSPPAAHSTICWTRLLQVPQPLPARVLSITPLTVLQPPCTVSTSVCLLTPLQLQTWACGSSSAALTSAGGPPRSNISDTRSSGSARPRSNACIRNATFLTSPTSVAPTSRSSRMMMLLYTPRLGSENTTVSSVSRSGALSPIDATSTPATLSFVAIREPWYAACVFVPVMWSASTRAWSQSGATSP